MRRLFILLALGVAACAPAPIPPPPVAEPVPATPAAPPPPIVRGEGAAPLATTAVLTRIAVGSGLDAARDAPILAAVARSRPDLLLLLGGVPARSETRDVYGQLNLHAQFSAFNMAVPMLATWGGETGTPAAGAEAERAFEAYWTTAAPGADHPGVHGGRVFGLPGRRVQILLLDVRTFQTADGLLGEDQWRWLEAALREPAEVRLVASPLPVLASDPGVEGWSHWPAERARLMAALRGASGLSVVLSTGGEGLSRPGEGPRDRFQELTVAGLNEDGSPPGFGLVEIDWTKRTVTLSARGLDGRSLDRGIFGW